MSKNKTMPDQSPPAADTAVELADVSFSYNGVPVVEDVNLRVADLEFLSLVGPNGGGKTTLLKIILGLLKPDTGSVLIFGMPPFQARRQLGYMPQHAFYDPKFPVTVMDVVLMGRLDRCPVGPYKKADKEAAMDALDQVALTDLRNRLFDHLSGGQRQRVLLARALACTPRLLLLDEPTANVDVAVEHKLFEILRDLNKRMAIIVVSHDLGFVSGFVQSVACINRRLVVHPTSKITGDVIQNMYGLDMRLIRHDHRCTEEGHRHA